MKASNLVISSVAKLELASVEWPIFDIAVSAASYPFLYSDHDWTDLGALAIPQFPDTVGTLRNWEQMFVCGSQTDTLALLKDLSVGVSEAARYQSRDEEGTQTPLETLSRGWGSCRDLAVLFTEAARVLGFGARIVSGYLYNPNQQRVGSGGTGSTHAWAEIFVPGAGWITFDPTNRSLGGFNLIPIAVARDIRQIAPVSGSYIGGTNAFAGMSVEVLVTSLLATEQLLCCKPIVSEQPRAAQRRGSIKSPIAIALQQAFALPASRHIGTSQQPSSDF
uniref:transglutaminase-like domain-containing protein n=1 Tax=Bradyrhizobium sp. 195 TaxID=2782662 RepID=UPI003211B4B3